MTAATQSVPQESISVHSTPPAAVWKKLAPLIAAPGRTQLRLYDTATRKFSDTGRLTASLPLRPAAVYLYAKARTRVLVLDFDAKHHSAEQVKADLDTAARWISSCGGQYVTDSSSTGGRHLIAPLAIGTSASCDEMTQLVRLFAARLPTLDITPNTNTETGCISVPGSADKTGGYRQLDGSLADALEAFTTRSDPALVPRLLMLLGALNPSPQRTPAATAAHVDDYLEGTGDDIRLAPPYRRTDELPDDVVDFATYGIVNPKRLTWQSLHEARMSVVVNAFARGYSIADLRNNIAVGGCWHDGLGNAYTRYKHRADIALSKDFDKALHWYITNILNSSPPRHREKKYSPGGKTQGWRGPKDLRDWLANALAWADGEYVGKRSRWTVRAVLQGLAFYAVVAGEQRSGSWLVGVGGRALSIGCGLLSEDSVWRTLADLRERPGAPLVLVRPALGTEADVYALTTQNRVSTDPVRAQRVRVEAVHPAWSVMGHHLRHIYELVAYHGLTNKADLYAAAAVARATGDTMVSALQIAGLLTKSGWGTVGVGHVTLDDIAQQQQLDQVREQRIQRHHAERAAWRSWLEERERQRSTAPEVPVVAPASRGNNDEEEYAAWQEATMATGPPQRDVIDDEREVIEMLTELLGARLVHAR
ncbi:hypothetical protein ABFW14_25760 [Mycolicibacterium fortuitum]|uniref:hypothetical protein n=1 Tax=Mycolicibacterium TaxID=1866885 RepID=UPI0003F60581|nr:MULTISPECIES: hypothetical protein [Mycolicibacterium]